MSYIIIFALSASLEDLPNKLGQLIDEYLGETDKRNIQGIFITVPGHNGYFIILDSFRLTLNESDTFSLSTLFSFNDKSRKGQSLADKIRVSKCFDSFTVKDNRKGLTYSKDFGNDKQYILDNIKCIIESLFSQVDTKNIDIELKRIAKWFTIEEQGSE